MEEEELNSSNVHGNSPEFGAIFMSNNATKKECFRRRLLGLPYSQFRFVEQVKAGMVLFLFEFEKRELHGVFQACSDGAIDIVPHAFSSSGMKFPAQVKFRPLWCCRPLCENEFRDAIRENYFSRYKFKFGLSEHQVRRLLLLFSSKRLKDESPERQLIGSEVASPDGYITSKNRRLVDDESRISNQVLGEFDMNKHHADGYITSKNRRLVDDESPISNQVLGEFDMNKHHAPVISTMHQGDSYYNDDGFRTSKDVEYEASAFLDDCFNDLLAKVGRENSRNCKVDDEWDTGITGNFRRISNDDRFSESDRLERKFYEADGFPQAASVANPSSFQSDVYPQVYSSKHVLETHSYVDELTRPAPMEMRNSNVSYALTSENSTVTSTLPCDLSSHGNYYQRSSSMGFNHEHSSLQEYHTRDSFVGNVLGSSTNQSFPSLLDPDVNSDFIPLPYSDQYEGSSRTSFPRHVYRDNLAAEYSSNERREDLSLLEPSIANEHSSPYGTFRSKIPYLPFPDRYPTLVQDKHDYKVPKRENDAEFDNNVFKECRSFQNDNRGTEDGRFSIYGNVGYENKERQHQLHVGEVASSSAIACRKRSSVFSRLALPPKSREQENNTSPNFGGIDRPNSVNDVMEMLHGNRHQWVQTRGKQLVKNRDVAAIVRDKNHDTRKDGTTMISKEMDEKPPSSFSKENSGQNTEETTFVDFKRRSAVRKSLEDGKVREIPNDANASTARSKKRKLIRPDFGVIESSDRGISSDTPENVTDISSDTPENVTAGITAESLKVTVCHVNENNILPNVMCQTAVESNSIDMGSGSNSEKCRMEVALINGNEDGDNGNTGIISNS